MPPKKTTTTTETPATTTSTGGAGTGAAAVAPTPVEAPQEAPKKGRKKKEVVQSETENETSNETADEESVDDEEESLDISVELSHVNELLMNINKNMKNADISNPLTQKIYIAFRDQSHKFEKTYLTLLAKASSKKGKVAKETRAPRNVNPENMAANQLRSVHPEILAFMGQPADQKLSRTDVQRFIYGLRSKDSIVKDETGAFLKKKPFYITKNDQLGRFFAIVRKIMTANGPQDADVQKGYIQQNGNLPEYIYNTSIFGYVPKVFVEDN